MTTIRSPTHRPHSISVLYNVRIIGFRGLRKTGSFELVIIHTTTLTLISLIQNNSDKSNNCTTVVIPIICACNDITAVYMHLVVPPIELTMFIDLRHC